MSLNTSEHVLWLETKPHLGVRDGCWAWLGVELVRSSGFWCFGGLAVIGSLRYKYKRCGRRGEGPVRVLSPECEVWGRSIGGFQQAVQSS